MAADTVMVRLDTLPEDVVQKILASASAQKLPDTTTTDNGKVLKVTSGKWAKGTITKELPSVSASDNGKVLKVVDGAWAAVLEE